MSANDQTVINCLAAKITVLESEIAQYASDIAAGMVRENALRNPRLPSPELTWIYTHCRAIGMVDKSDSGKWEHDIALFTQNQASRIKELEVEVERLVRQMQK